jgi:hypothetical protein
LVGKDFELKFEKVTDKANLQIMNIKIKMHN